MKHLWAGRLACGAVMMLANAACLKVRPAEPELSQIGNHLRFTGESAILKTHSDGRHVFVSGYVGEKGPYNIIVDTGAGPNVIDRALAEEMGFEITGEREVLSGGVEPVKTDIVAVPRLSVNNLAVENAEFITLELAEMSLGQFHGVLGMELFHEALLTFDPRRDRITVRQETLSVGGPGVVSYDGADSGFRVNIDAAGQEVAMIFDTGAPSGFTLPFVLSDALPLKGLLREGPAAQLVGGKRSIWIGDLDGDIVLGEEVYHEPEVTFMNPSAPHGNIGNAILKDLVLTIDQQNRLLALRRFDKPAVTQAVASPENAGNPRRLGIQFRGLGGGALSVSWVEPGSLGEQAGFKAGDVLVALNGKPASEYDMKALGDLFRSEAPLRFEVERKGEPRTIEIR